MTLKSWEVAAPWAGRESSELGLQGRAESTSQWIHTCGDTVWDREWGHGLLTEPSEGRFSLQGPGMSPGSFFSDSRMGQQCRMQTGTRIISQIPAHLEIPGFVTQEVKCSSSVKP